MQLGLNRSLIAIVLLAGVFVWNMRETYPHRSIWWKIMPMSCNPIFRATYLDQRWDMFSPFPLTDDGWYVMRGTLRDGSVVNLWEPGKTVDSAKPKLVSAGYPTERWRKYLMTICSRDKIEHRRHFANWLRHRWNTEHAGDKYSNQLKTVEIVYHCEMTPPPGEPVPAAQPIALWTWNYE